jgi:hypothetical protein
MEVTEEQYERIKDALAVQRGNVRLSNPQVLNAVLYVAEQGCKVHPDGTGALKNGPQAIGKSRGGWNTKVHLVAANARTAITFALSPGHAHDAPEGRALLAELGPMPEGLPLLMDRAYKGTKPDNWCSVWA